MIGEAAGGHQEQRAEFVRRYGPIVVEYLAARWRGTALLAEVRDVTHDVFLESFRLGGVLERAEPTRSGGFRAFFYGVVRNVARRHEDARARRREQQPSTSFDADACENPETSLSRVLDRAWARAVLDEAGARHRRAAEAQGEEALLRVELLRLRYEEGLPVREIARCWKMAADKVHQEARRARREFRRCLEAELAFQGENEVDVEKQWEEFLSLLQ